MFSNSGLLVSMHVAGIFACRDRVNQTPEFAPRVVVDGWTRIDGGL